MKLVSAHQAEGKAKEWLPEGGYSEFTKIESHGQARL